MAQQVGPRPPRTSRALAIVVLLFLAPVCASCCRPISPWPATWRPPSSSVLFLGPLYGGAALLIREVAVRTGRGWIGVVMLATAFGVAMTALIDLSLWITDRTDVHGWDQITGRRPVSGSASSPWHRGSAATWC